VHLPLFYGPLWHFNLALFSAIQCRCCVSGNRIRKSFASTVIIAFYYFRQERETQELWTLGEKSCSRSSSCSWSWS